MIGVCPDRLNTPQLFFQDGVLNKSIITALPQVMWNKYKFLGVETMRGVFHLMRFKAQ